MCPKTEFFLVSVPKRIEPTNFTNYNMVVLPECRSKHGAFTERSKNFKAAISKVFYKEGVLEGFEIFTSVKVSFLIKLGLVVVFATLGNTSEEQRVLKVEARLGPLQMPVKELLCENNYKLYPLTIFTNVMR